MSDFDAMNTVYAGFFSTPATRPTRMAAAATLVGDGLVEIKCSGWAPAPQLDAHAVEARSAA